MNTRLLNTFSWGPKSERKIMREAKIARKTKETDIEVLVNIDGTGMYDVDTGIGYDHMLEQLSRHSLMDLTVRAKGDLHIDHHHTTELMAIGEAIYQAMANAAVSCAMHPPPFRWTKH